MNSSQHFKKFRITYVTNKNVIIQGIIMLNANYVNKENLK